MKIKGIKLEYYAIETDANTKKPVKINVIRDSLKNDIARMIRNKSISNRNELYEYLKTEFLCLYWAKCEHEILISNLFAKEGEVYKLDVFTQIYPNLWMITDYIIQKMKIDFEKGD